MERYIPRSIEPVIKRAVREFPAVVLTGPRQSGKTTLLRHLFDGALRYVSIEPPDVRAAAEADPRGFLEMHAAPVILDEVQNSPSLLPYIKERIDARRGARGQYILTGSQNLLLLQRITETLAGRVAVLRLLPLAWREATGKPRAPLPWETGRSVRAAIPRAGLWDGILRGGYPELTRDRGRDPALWHGSYVQTYLERDVRSLRQIGDLTTFQAFLRALAARCGQLLNLADVARDLGLAVNTAKAWLSVLEATYQVLVLRPYFANVGKRLVKTPKVYFADVGTLCYLCGLRDAESAATGPMGGVLFEAAVVMEVVKTLTHRAEDPRVYFWRTSAGTEVDLIVESEGRLVPVEVKLSSTPRPAMAEGILKFRADFPKTAAPGFVVHPGHERLPLAPHVTALPFSSL